MPVPGDEGEVGDLDEEEAEEVVSTIPSTTRWTLSSKRGLKITAGHRLPEKMDGVEVEELIHPTLETLHPAEVGDSHNPFAPIQQHRP